MMERPGSPSRLVRPICEQDFRKPLAMHLMPAGQRATMVMMLDAFILRFSPDLGMSVSKAFHGVLEWVRCFCLSSLRMHSDILCSVWDAYHVLHSQIRLSH